MFFKGLRLLSLISFLAAAFALSGCSENGVPINRNDPEKERYLQPLGFEKDQKQISIESYDLKPLYKSLKISGSDVFNHVTQPLAKFILDPDVIRNKKYSTLPKIQEMLQLFNLSILELHKNKRADIASILDQYDVQLMEGCKKNMEGCQNLSYFSRDPGSAKVAQILAQRFEQVDSFYQRLLIAFSIKNRLLDEELTVLYLRRSREYLSSLEKNPEENRDRILQHQKVIALIIQFTKDEAKAKSIAPLMNEFSPWAFSRLNNHALGDGAQDLLKLIARTSIYEGGKSGQSLNSELSKFIADSQKESDSFTKHQDQMLKENPKIVANLNLNQVTNSSEYFYLVDRIFRNHISANDAYAIWQNTHQNKDHLAKTIQNYIQMEMGYWIKSSNEQLSLFFKDEDKANRQTLHEDVVRFSHVISSHWKNYIRKTDVLAEFAAQIFDFVGKRDQVSFELSKAFSGVRRTIKFSSVYPHMMMLAYEMGKRDFSKGFDYDIKNLKGSSYLIGKFFNGEGVPWFEYGTDMAPLTRFEILDAFQFALATDIFSTFNSDPGEFLEVMSDRLLTPKLNLLKAQLDRIVKKYESTPEWSKLVDICQSVQSGRSFTFSYAINDLLASPFLGSTMTALALANVGGEGSGKSVETNNLTVAGAISYNPYDHEFVNLLERTRIEIEPTLQFLESMKRLYEVYLAKAGASKDFISRKAKSFDEKLDSIKKIKREFVGKFKLRSSQYSKCYFVLMQYDLNLQSKIFAAEAKYLKEIHRDMTAVRKDPLAASMLNRKYSFSRLPENFTGYNSFDGTALRYFPIDFMFRVKGYLNRDFPQLEVTVPETLKEWSPYYDARPFMVHYSEDENTFIANGLHAMLDAGVKQWFSSRYMNWPYWRNWLNAIAVLYRLEEIAEASEVVNVPLEMFKLISIGESDIPFFNLTGLQSRFADAKVRDILGFKGDEPKGYLDSIHGWLYSDYAAEYGNSEMFTCQYGMQCAPPKELLPLFKRAKEYFRWSTDRIGYMFLLETSVKSSIGVALKESIKKEEERVKAFEAAAERRYGADQSSNSLVILQMNLGLQYRPAYLSSTAKEKFRSELSNFHVRETSNIFNK